MRLRIKRILIECENLDQEHEQGLTLVVGKDTDYGWKVEGQAPLFPRYLQLMSTLSEFLRAEKKL